MSGMARFAELLARKNQRFVCRGVSLDGPATDPFVAHIEHRVEGPAPASVREPMLQRLRNVPELAAFYDEYGSARLYCDTIGIASAFYIGSPDAWARLKKDLNKWFELLDYDEEEELLPDWIDACVVFGEIPMSGNYLLMPMSGELTGQVFEFEHDGFEFIRRGENFDEFLSWVSTVDDKLLQDIGGHTRYSDGETETQWMPEKYEFDE